MTNTDWMNGDPAGPGQPPLDLQIDRPHPARVYDYLLGGKDNFPADRAAAEAGLGHRRRPAGQCRRLRLRGRGPQAVTPGPPIRRGR
jgi:hypothetical protein